MAEKSESHEEIGRLDLARLDWSIKAGGKAPVCPLHYTIVWRIKSGSAVRQYALEGDFSTSFPICKCCRMYRILLVHALSC